MGHPAKRTRRVIYNQALTWHRGWIDFGVRYLRVQSMAVPGRFAGESNDTAAGTAEFSGIGKSGVSKEISGGRKPIRFLSPWGGAGAALLLAALAGCGNMYRPVITPVRPTGPSPAPTAYVVSITQPTGAQAGIATVLDFSGDTVLAQATIGDLPLDFTLDSAGATAYTVDRDGSLSDIPISTSLQTKNVSTSTLTPTAIPINTITGSGVLYVIDQASDQLDVLSGIPPGLKQAIQFPLGLINLAGRTGSTRFYGISQNVGPAVCATPGAVTT